QALREYGKPTNMALDYLFVTEHVRGRIDRQELLAYVGDFEGLPDRPYALAQRWYRRAFVHMLAGEATKAEELFRRTVEFGLHHGGPEYTYFSYLGLARTFDTAVYAAEALACTNDPQEMVEALLLMDEKHLVMAAEMARDHGFLFLEVRACLKLLARTSKTRRLRYVQRLSALVSGSADLAEYCRSSADTQAILRELLALEPEARGELRPVADFLFPMSLRKAEVVFPAGDLADLQLVLGGVRVPVSWGRNGARMLFHCLVNHPDGIPKERIMEELWPRNDLSMLYKTLGILKRYLDPLDQDAGSPFITTNKGALAWNWGRTIASDQEHLPTLAYLPNGPAKLPKSRKKAIVA
ncbi:MAG: hypothetical protein KGR26_11650, partial [Cyanobacteria bacterium REEB65]|nr:hypothetical protein [Cyanobacteria bacterium REEB65]